MENAFVVVVMVIFAAVIELALHWFPWKKILRQELPRLWAYGLGVLGFALPYSVYLLLYPCGLALVAFWCVVAAAGAAVGLGWLVDYGIERSARAENAEEGERVLKERDHDAHEQVR